jgi:hypothetical protein
MKKYVAALILITLVGLGFRLFIALRLPNDAPDDGRLYSQIARNVLEHRSYSIETEDPYPPTYIRVPGYPLFLAGVYSLFGHENDRAVRVVQAILDTLTCWLIALLAVAWAPAGWDGQKRRKLLPIALTLAVCCPFPAIYIATILTETCTTLLATACALAGTLALKTANLAKSGGWLLLAGLSGGVATLFRPDSGLFVAAVGFTIVVVGLYRIVFRQNPAEPVSNDVLTGTRRHIFNRTVLSGAMLTLGFVISLTPWTIRNARVFGVFQPICPAQANMPGEFVPNGYIGWLKTWVSDVHYTELIEFPLDQDQIHIEDMPDSAFDSPEERQRVARLLDQYNHPPSAQPQIPAPEAKKAGTDAGSQPDESESDDDESGAADADESDDSDKPEEPEAKQPVEMTPEVDAGFAELARERIARNPLRYHVIVPLKRVGSMWFDTHAQYYPFEGELLPLSSLDTDLHQQYWLPLFAFLTLLYTCLGLAGLWLMWRDKASRRWLLMLVLLTVPRLVLLSKMENPEPRYVVEYFAFVAAVGAIAIVAGYDRVRAKKSIEFTH